MLATIENPCTQIIAHPTGRLLLRRDAFDYDIGARRLRETRRGHGMHSYPERLDLKDVYLRIYKELNITVVIETDAHTTTNLSFIRNGVTTARRGWLEKKNVINTLPCDEFLAALRLKPSAVDKKRAAKANR